LQESKVKNGCTFDLAQLTKLLLLLVCVGGIMQRYDNEVNSQCIAANQDAQAWSTGNR
jgi:hypothetical protein